MEDFLLFQMTSVKQFNSIYYSILFFVFVQNLRFSRLQCGPKFRLCCADRLRIVVSGRHDSSGNRFDLGQRGRNLHRRIRSSNNDDKGVDVSLLRFFFSFDHTSNNDNIDNNDDNDNIDIGVSSFTFCFYFKSVMILTSNNANNDSNDDLNNIDIGVSLFAFLLLL